MALRVFARRNFAGRSTLSLSSHPLPLATLQTAHSYHSIYHPQEQPYPPVQAKILASAYEQVPAHGFTQTALDEGARRAGYLEVSTQLFPRGSFDLIAYHLATQRLALSSRVQFPSPDSSRASLTEKVQTLMWSRLVANAEAGVLPHWQDALAQMSLLENIPTSLKELGLLSDEIWYLAGDQTVDFGWYTKRASLSTVYASTEIFMTTDTSPGHRDTKDFMQRRLTDSKVMGNVTGGALQLAGWWARGGLGVARSFGVKV